MCVVVDVFYVVGIVAGAVASVVWCCVYVVGGCVVVVCFYIVVVVVVVVCRGWIWFVVLGMVCVNVVDVSVVVDVAFGGCVGVGSCVDGVVGIDYGVCGDGCVVCLRCCCCCGVRVWRR